ncbi:DNA polymerase IV [Patescibacteria group bacterium]|nr:DNA polymerase IV [Patescibacteria group bacterium]
MKNRIVLLLDMDAFFAMVEERENPHFRGKPVVVGADPKEGKGRGVVSTCNYEARKYGIHSAMPISEAWRLCPQAVFLPVDGALYHKASENIMTILRKYTLLVEQVSLDEAYLDISFVGSFENARKLAEKIRKEIFKKEKLPASCGIAPNKMVAKIACEHAKPNGVLVVEPQKVESFLSSLSIREIPGIGPKTAAILEKFFKKKALKIKDVRETSKEELVKLLGVFGSTLYDKVRGIDHSPVTVKEEVKSIGREHTFERDTRDGEEIFPVFRELAREVASELKEAGLAFKTITVVCRFHGFETHTKAKSFKEPQKDWKLFEKEAMQLLLRFLTENLNPIRLIGVRARVAQSTL